MSRRLARVSAGASATSRDREVGGGGAGCRLLSSSAVRLWLALLERSSLRGGTGGRRAFETGALGLWATTHKQCAARDTRPMRSECDPGQ